MRRRRRLRRPSAEVRTWPILTEFGAACLDRVPRSWMRLRLLTLACRRLLSCKFCVSGCESVTDSETRARIAGTARPAAAAPSARTARAHVLLHLRVFGALVGGEKLIDGGVRLCPGQSGLRGEAADCSCCLLHGGWVVGLYGSVQAVVRCFHAGAGGLAVGFGGGEQRGDLRLLRGGE